MNNTDDEIIDEKTFGLRLAKLRQSVDVSAREMSLALGQNKNYINSIETGKTFLWRQGTYPSDYAQSSGKCCKIYG